MSPRERSEFGQRIRVGLDIYRKRLVEQYAKEDDSLIFSKDKKIYRVKAKDLLDTI